MGRDLRHHRRYDVVDVRGSLLVSLDARILNMSLTGMAIETGSMLKVGGSYSLRLTQDNEPLRLKTQVKWCQLVRNELNRDGDRRPVYHAGLDFREGLDESARQLLAFLEQHIVVEIDRRLTGRFRLATPRDASIAIRHDFEVRRLSLGGMLVETVWDPPVDTQLELEVNTAKGVVRSRGRVRTVTPIPGAPGETPMFALGLEFLSLAAEHRQTLSALLETLLE